MNPRRLIVLWGAVAGLAWAAGAAGGEPFVPSSADCVLVRLPPGLRADAGGRPPAARLEEALVEARRLTIAARREGDPRWLGHARRVLAPWWDQPEAPTDVVLLRAQVRQGLHEFDGALADLDGILRREPRHAGAWLMKASLHQVLGQFPAAQRACLALARFGDELTAVTASASLGSLVDPAGHADAVLAAVLDRNAAAPAEERAWAWTTLGEIHARAGRFEDADRCFREALTLEPDSAYVLASRADLWLDAGRTEEVAAWLAGTTNPTLRLRRAEAEVRRAAGAAETRRLVEELGESFDLENLRGDGLHRREHARFLLRLRGDPAAAWALARRNWEIQREPADARLLLEAATARADEALVAEARELVRRVYPAWLGRREVTAGIGDGKEWLR